MTDAFIVVLLSPSKQFPFWYLRSTTGRFLPIPFHLWYIIVLPFMIHYLLSNLWYIIFLPFMMD